MSKVEIEYAPEDCAEPPCKHFGICGGCMLQHITAERYTAWKRTELLTMLAFNRIETELRSLVSALPRSRRRATFAATRTKKGVTFGFYARGTHNIVPIDECPLVVPEIESALPKLARLVEAGLSRKGRTALLVTATETGLDVAVAGAKKLNDGLFRAELASRAANADLARLTWEGDVIVERRAPLVDFSGLKVTPPPGAFLQPTREGEAALIHCVLEGVRSAHHVADLFAGCGTFTAALARRASVLAAESDGRQLKALDRAIRAQGPAFGMKPVEARTRDLFKRPLLAQELTHFEAVVFDPPRAGAAAQAIELAKSKVPIVVAVSCYPPTFMRDACILIGGDYTLKHVTPIDQFLWSTHLELVAVFERR